MLWWYEVQESSILENGTFFLICAKVKNGCCSGVHHKKNNCESTAVISKVQQVLNTAKRHLYPNYLTLTYTTLLKKTKLRKGNGGWGDRRDHKLCMSMTLR